MEFKPSIIYLDREGNEYRYIYKTGGVTVFENNEAKRFAQHSTGRYRWDNQDHPRDIIGKK